MTKLAMIESKEARERAKFVAQFGPPWYFGHWREAAIVGLCALVAAAFHTRLPGVVLEAITPIQIITGGSKWPRPFGRVLPRNVLTLAACLPLLYFQYGLISAEDCLALFAISAVAKFVIPRLELALLQPGA